jgi:2C-methyl-D-erythritol 2,4-cyclodiphosphate synthase
MAEAYLNQKQLVGVGHDSHRITEKKEHIVLGGVSISC